jgi:hypothetical protein
MPLYAKSKGGEDFPIVGPGMKQGVCYLIADIGTQPSNSPQFKPRRQVVIGWELPGEPKIEIERDRKKTLMPRVLSRTFGLSLSKKSNLKPVLESWRGRPFTEVELDGFDLQKVLGANCLLNVINERRDDGKTFANIASVSPLMPQMVKARAENPLTFFSFEDYPKGAITIPATVHDWIKAKIMQSKEWLERQQHPDTRQAAPDEAQAGDEYVPF